MIWDENRIRAEIRRLDRKTGLDGASLPISFSHAENTLGVFYSGGGDHGERFRFSNLWFQNPDWPPECALDVIRHEYAHYMDYEIYGNSGHGRTWKACCRRVGAIPVRLYEDRMEDFYRRKRQKNEELSARLDRLSAGMLIMHPRFDLGTILSMEGEGAQRSLTVDFGQSGVRRLSGAWVLENCAIEWPQSGAPAGGAA